MKIIKVASCCQCPNLYHITYCGYDDTDPDKHSRYMCRKEDRALALKNLEQIIKPLVVCVVTQSIIPGVTNWIHSADGKTKWDGKIPDWCPLEDYPFDVKEWSNL